MVRAILAGTKTQTRRVVKPQPVGNADVQFRVAAAVTLAPDGKQLRCPYGQTGDRLWVRETFAPLTKGFAYAADPVWNEPPGGRWMPSIHMPRIASRIDLEITAVRVERLNDISEADARAEGAPPSHPSIDRISREYGFADFPRSWYGQLWDQINGAGSWAANPWVWCIEFKRVAP